MARYQLILAYDGTDFSGFQRQGKTRTVQLVVEQALAELGWQEETILFAGRTDAGVHASGQVIGFSLEWQHEDVTLLNALNARMPADVSVLQISRTEAEFHPRYDASSRSYAYTLYHLPQRQPLIERNAWRIWPALEGAPLNEAARIFLGRHDFAAFGRAMKKDGSTIREVFESRWIETSTGWRYEITANAFLYHMVRRLVFVQVRAAQGFLSLQNLEEGLHHQVKLKPGLAPPHGLVLTRVDFMNKAR
jgi:tRNA pseudouridine38-40 synthase